MYIKDTIKYKERQDLSKLDETIEYMWIECQGKNKNKNYLVGILEQNGTKSTWNKIIAIAGDTNCT